MGSKLIRLLDLVPTVQTVPPLSTNIPLGHVPFGKVYSLTYCVGIIWIVCDGLSGFKGCVSSKVCAREILTDEKITTKNNIILIEIDTDMENAMFPVFIVRPVFLFLTIFSIH